MRRPCLFHKKDVPFYGIACLALAIGGLLPFSLAYPGLKSVGYPLCLLLLVGLLHQARYLPQVMAKVNWKTERTSVLTVFVIGTVFTLSVPGTYHVMQDEAAQLGTALSMSTHKEVGIAMTGVWDRGQFYVTQSMLDKRPFFQPFLVSLLHDSIGYDVHNALWLNRVLAIASLLVLYALIRSFLPTAPAAVATALMASTPIFLLAANGYGFEIANFFFIALYALALAAYLRRPEAKREAFLVLVCCILTYLRYESALLAVPAYITILLCREEGKSLHPFTLLSPLFYVPFTWLVRLSTARVDNWQELSSGFGLELQPFALGHFLPNLIAAFTFAADPTAEHTNNFLLLVGAIVGLWGLVWVYARKTTIVGFEKRRDFKYFALALTCGIGLLSLIIAGYHWSQFTDPLAVRMSLPFFVPCSMLAAFALAWIRCRSSIWLLVPLVVFLIHTKPSVDSFNLQTADHRRSIETAKQAWLDGCEIDHRRTLVLDTKGVLFWTSNRVASVRSGMDEVQLEKVLLQYAAGRFERVLIVAEEYLIAGGAWGGTPDLPPSLGQAAEPVFRQYFGSSSRVSIYPLTGIRGSRLFEQFWAAQAGKTDTASVYAAWDRFLLQNLPHL